MSNKLYSEESIQAIANSIRAKNGTSETYTVSEMSTAINALPTNLTTKTITANGTYNASSDDADGYSSVTVAVEGYAKKSIANTPTDIATFNASALPMPSLTVGIKATQSGNGDPSPTNVRPISGWSAVNVYDTGINVWDEEWEGGGYNINTGEKSVDNSRMRCKNLIPVKPSTTYYFNMMNNYNAYYYILFYGKDGVFLSNASKYKNVTFTTPNNCYYITFYIINWTTYNNDISINYPSTDTEYHAYNGQTYTIPFTDSQGNPVEVYGGSVDVVNGTSGNKKIYDIVVFDGSEDENITLYNAQSGAFWLGAVDSMKDYSLSSQIPPFVSDYLKTVSQSSSWVSGIISEDTKTKRIVACLSDFGTSVAECRQYLSQHPLTIRYELATPLTIQLTPTAISTQDGTNNLWADSGDIQSGEYMEAL